MKATYTRYLLNFKRPSGTSRGVLTQKETWFIILEQAGKKGIGECGILRGLSIDDTPKYEEKLQWTCNNIHLGLDTLLTELTEFPSIQFGLEIAFRSIESQTMFNLFPSKFTIGEKAIPINGLVWMGDKAFMKSQISEKLAQGFSCIKMKIGAIDFETEIQLLKAIRTQFSVNDVQLRVDANGAFKPHEALTKLEQLAKLDIHSIEQPIKQGQWEVMSQLCESTPLPIALDEELIGFYTAAKKEELLKAIKPQYIILKPSLIGGFKGSQEWISLANSQAIGWWITSALESNIGLNAIAQWTYTLNSNMYQGLGTGSLFTNNIDSPLKVKNGTLRYEQNLDWNLNL